ncbi:MAG: MFS transporter [Marinilabiliales bacterium]|nr:MAG: MFS transporter [Marinilabiliales bacterium]
MEDFKSALNDSAILRWGIMLLVSFTMATNYYFYDAISPLKFLMERELGFSSAEYGFFQAAYSIPNVFLLMAVIGGVILDRIGIRITGFAFIFIQFAGAVVTAYGATPYFNQGGWGYDFMNSFLTAYSPALKVTSLGFFLFGLGAETSIVVISKVIVKWFKGKEIALALGLNIAIARLGMGAAMVLSPRLIIEGSQLTPLWQNWTMPIWFGALLLGVGLLAFLVYMIWDIRFDRRVAERMETDPTEEFRLRDLARLMTNRSFIYITMLCVLFYSAVFPFMKYAPDLMINKFGVDPTMAGDISSILPFGTLVFTPVFAWICDYRGRSASLMVYGSLLVVGVHLSFAFTNITPYIPMFVLGIAFSLVPAAMWPAVTKIVETSRIGTAYGAMFTIQAIGLMVFPWLIGLVLDYTNPGVSETLAAGGKALYDYTQALVMLAMLGVVGLVFAWLLKREDRTSGYGLEEPNKMD